ncbi:hypothetical protein [Streptomyces mirabilis]|uniref:hypothetical protein n=1 Tax=Streptomyces mirabilis TaxID=68239 RepID=UPI003F754629
MAAPAVVRDLRELWAPASEEELEQFETDPPSGFVLARASAGLTDGTIRGDVRHLDQIRSWFGRPPWDMESADADAYFGKVLRGSPSGTRLARSQALPTVESPPSANDFGPPIAVAAHGQDGTPAERRVRLVAQGVHIDLDDVGFRWAL